MKIWIASLILLPSALAGCAGTPAGPVAEDHDLSGSGGAETGWLQGVLGPDEVVEQTFSVAVHHGSLLIALDLDYMDASLFEMDPGWTLTVVSPSSTEMEWSEPSLVRRDYPDHTSAPFRASVDDPEPGTWVLVFEPRGDVQVEYWLAWRAEGP